MSVIVELNSDRAGSLINAGDLRAARISVSRVPAVDEIIRALAIVNGGTKALWFQVTRVVHNANTETFPRRNGELDAWVFCVPCEEVWR